MGGDDKLSSYRPSTLVDIGVFASGEGDELGAPPSPSRAGPRAGIDRGRDDDLIELEAMPAAKQ